MVKTNSQIVFDITSHGEAESLTVVVTLSCSHASPLFDVYKDETTEFRFDSEFGEISSHTQGSIIYTKQMLTSTGNGQAINRTQNHNCIIDCIAGSGRTFSDVNVYTS